MIEELERLLDQSASSQAVPASPHGIDVAVSSAEQHDPDAAGRSIFSMAMATRWLDHRCRCLVRSGFVVGG